MFARLSRSVLLTSMSLLLMVLLFLLVACSEERVAGPVASNSLSTSSPEITPTSVPLTRLTPTVAAPSVTALPSTGSVSLELSASTYSPGQIIPILVRNQSPQTLYISDHRTACSILDLQYERAGSWQDLPACHSMTVTRLLSLAPGQSLAVQLISSPQWPAGLYRAVLTYETDAQPGPVHVYSQTFTLAH
jgi:hypothetical protein